MPHVMRTVKARCNVETETRIAISRRRLFLKEIVEGAAGVSGPGGTAGILALRGSRGRGGDGRGIFFDGHAAFVEFAIVAGVFFGDAFRNRLSAFEARAGVKMNALLAAMQLETTLGTFRIRIGSGSQSVTASRAARAHHGANHVRRARADLFLASRARQGSAFALLWLFRTIGVLVTMLSIFRQTNLRRALHPVRNGRVQAFAGPHHRRRMLLSNEEFLKLRPRPHLNCEKLFPGVQIKRDGFMFVTRRVA